MGNNQGTETPKRISLASIIDSDCSGHTKAVTDFTTYIKEHGYALLDGTDEVINNVQAYKQSAQLFFQQSSQIKQKYSQDMRSNDRTRGYNITDENKEYIKCRYNDADGMIPDTGTFRDSFRRAFSSIRSMSWTLFSHLAATQILLNDGTTRKLLPDADMVEINKIVDSRSSLGAIHYFAQQQKDNNEENNDARVASKEHRDTGLITVGFVANTPGLEIYDKKQGTFMSIEQLVPPGTIAVWLGEKMPLFSGSSNFNATHEIEQLR